MIANQDYVFYTDAMLMSSRQPFQNAKACVISTKDFIFCIPKKTTGVFVIVTTIKTHQYFDGFSVEEGVRKLLSEASSVEELEETFKSLLENDSKYVHEVASKTFFKFRGFLGQYTLTMKVDGSRHHSSVLINGKGKSKEFKTFHGQ